MDGRVHIHQTFDAVLQESHVEVDQETHGIPAELHIRQHLRDVDWRQAAYRFQFDCNELFSDDIDLCPQSITTSS